MVGGNPFSRWNRRMNARMSFDFSFRDIGPAPLVSPKVGGPGTRGTLLHIGATSQQVLRTGGTDQTAPGLRRRCTFRPQPDERGDGVDTNAVWRRLAGSPRRAVIARDRNRFRR